MIISKERGDLFTSLMQTWTNPINCAGAMGRGLALGFKQRFPQMNTDYMRRCAHNEVRLGQPYLWHRESAERLGTSTPRSVLNFPTKGHWRDRSHLEDVIAGLDYLEANYRLWGISSLAVPALGCGLGGLDPQLVIPILEDRLGALDIDVELYVPLVDAAA